MSKYALKNLLAVLILLPLGVLLFDACGNRPGAEQTTCSVYATDTVCEKSLSCQCATAGCFCVKSCDPTVSDAGCGAKAVCGAGSRPTEGRTGFFCFSPDAGS